MGNDAVLSAITTDMANSGEKDISATWRPSGDTLANIALGSKTRLVAAAIRLRKVSKQDNESGVIKVINCQQAISADKSIKDTIDSMLYKQNTLKVYPAHVGQCGCDGFLFDSHYRPDKQSDIDNYYQNSDYEFMMTNEELFGQKDGNWEAAAIADNGYLGPVYSTEINNNANMVWVPETIFNKHNTVIAFEGMTVGMTFEVEMIRYVEMIPDSESSLLETRSARLENFGSALELLRRQDIASGYFTVEYGLNIW